jgi:hypothetical protein
MSRKDIEARLDRSLANQIAVPRLDARFDAGVWARIEAASATATNPGREVREPGVSRAPRWLAISNAIGIIAAIVVAVYFGLRAFDAPAVSGAMPEIAIPVISEAMLVQIAQALGHVLGGGALLFGLSLTSIGQRIRAAFG